MSDSLREFVAVCIACLLMFVGVIAFCAGLEALHSRMSYPTKRADFEQLRKDAAEVDPTQAEDVIGQVVEANRALISAQQCNRLWYCDFLKTDKWNSVTVIAVPKVAK